MNDNNMLHDICNCHILPLERLPLDNYDGPFQEDGATPTNWFEELHFDIDPIPIQPTLCLVNWLQARCIDAHPT